MSTYPTVIQAQHWQTVCQYDKTWLVSAAAAEQHRVIVHVFSHINLVLSGYRQLYSVWWVCMSAPVIMQGSDYFFCSKMWGCLFRSLQGQDCGGGRRHSGSGEGSSGASKLVITILSWQAILFLEVLC